MSWSITNGDGTITYSGLTETAARRVAAELAEKHGEVFYVAEAGRTYPETKPHLGLGEPVSPAADATEDWIPTHRITWRPASGPHVVWEVMLCDVIQVTSEDDAPNGDGPAYTREDWDRGDNASWGVVHGEWLCEGQATPGGAKGEVVVEKLSDDDATECAYCQRTVAFSEGSPPALDDDAAWSELAGEHAPTCEWVLTRAHRRDSPRVATEAALTDNMDLW